MYLNQFDSTQNEVDGITEIVSLQTKKIISLLESDIEVYPHLKEPSMKMIFKGKFIARIVEGCNGVNVMILFSAFIFAFSSNFKRTFFYILFGVSIIHFLNILRIAILSFSLYYYPEKEELLHGTLFPLFIYGVVFILWILWVTQFSGYAKKNK